MQPIKFKHNDLLASTDRKRRCNKIRTMTLYSGHSDSLCFTSLQQRGHLDTTPSFTVPCEGREAW